MRLVDEYLAALETTDAVRILALFTDDATVDSPLYGIVPARDFYPRLFRDTAQSRLTLRSVMLGQTTDRRPTVAFWFDCDGPLPAAPRAPFTVVDVASSTRKSASRRSTSCTTPRRCEPASRHS